MPGLPDDLVVTNGLVIFGACDSGVLLCVDGATGQPVWVVDATLKEGARHIYKRRVFYLDEDSYQIVLIDHYDGREQLWRVSECHSINYYDVPTTWSTIEAHYDLQSGRYVAQGFDNTMPVNTFNVEMQAAQFTPQALRTRGKR